MAGKTTCELWHDLIYGKIPFIGDFYKELVKNKDALVVHLDNHNRCRSLILSLIPADTVRNLKNMSDDDFLKTITDIRNRAIARRRPNKTP